jgi:dynein heavy chain
MYTYSVEQANDAVMDAFNNCLTSVNTIPQVEHQVMEGLFWSRRPNIASISSKERVESNVIVEPGVEHLNVRISNALSRVKEPLNNYLKCYDDHIEFLNLNVNDLINSLKPIVKDDISTLRRPALIMLVNHHINAKKQILASIPSSIVELGLIVVDANMIRDELKEKHELIIKSLLNILAAHIKTNGRRLLSQFEGMAKKLQTFARNIEELSELQDYCNGAPGLIEEMKEFMVSLYSDFDCLESFNYQAPVLFHQRWEICQWPRRIKKIIQRTSAQIESKKQQYSLQMADEQVIFEQTLAQLEAEVRSFGSYTNIRKSKEVEVHRLGLTKKLEDAKKQVVTFNSREMLFGKELTNYSQFESIMESWEPFDILWKTTYKWLTSYDTWMNGPFQQVDGLQVETLVEDLAKDIYKGKKMLEKMNMQACADIASEVARQIEELKPNVPFILGMRNVGMRERHWKQLSSEIGQDIAPDNDPDFTLQTAFDMELYKYGELVSRVGATAGKEYQIESGSNTK